MHAMLSYKLYKLLCYLAAAFNILLVLEIAADVLLPFTSRVMAAMILSLCLANFVLAVLLIVGVAKRQPSLIKAFRTFVFLQMTFLGLIAVYLFHSERVAANAVPMLIALFGIETLIASGGLQTLLNEPPPKCHRL